MVSKTALASVHLLVAPEERKGSQHTCIVVDSNQVFEVFQGKLLVFGKKPHTSLKDLGRHRVLITMILDQGIRHVEVTSKSAALAGFLEDLS